MTYFFNTKAIFFNVFLFFVIFFHVLNLKLNLPPYNLIFLSTFFSFIYLYTNKLIVDFYFFYVLLIILLQALLLAISLLVNQILDYSFLKEIIIFELFALFSAYFIVLISLKRYKENAFERICYLVFLVVLFQLIVSFFGYINSAFFNLLFLIFNLGDHEIVSNLSEERMVGLGAAFFGSGVINCIVLILIASFIITEKNFSKKINLLILYFMIAILGMFSARTTSVGIILSLILIILNFKNFKLKFIILTTFIFVFIALLNVKYFSDSRVGQLMNFSLGFLTDFEGSNASNSTNDLLNMYSKLPDNFKTWLIGDALYRDGYKYYKNIDIGYFRFIYVNGLIGLLVYMFFNIYLIFKIKSRRITIFAKFLLLFLFIILMGKGVALFFPILFLLYLSSKRKDILYN